MAQAHAHGMPERRGARRSGRGYGHRPRLIHVTDPGPPGVVEMGSRGWADVADLVALRPKTRGDCANVSRPCPYVSCRHHLFLDVLSEGTIALNHGDREPWEIDPEASCALDVAADGYHDSVEEIQEAATPRTLDEVGEILDLSRERIRQIEERAMRRLGGRFDRQQSGHVRRPDLLALGDELRPDPTRYHLPIVESESDFSGHDGQRDLGKILRERFPEQYSGRSAPRPVHRPMGDGKRALLAHLDAHGATSLTELGALPEYGGRKSVAGVALNELRKKGLVVRVSRGVWGRPGATAPKPIVAAPTERVSVMEDAMSEMRDKAIEFLASKCQAFTLEEVQAAIGSASPGATEVMLGKMVGLGLVVRPAPRRYAAKENANALGSILDERSRGKVKRKAAVDPSAIIPMLAPPPVDQDRLLGDLDALEGYHAGIISAIQRFRELLVGAGKSKRAA